MNTITHTDTHPAVIEATRRLEAVRQKQREAVAERERLEAKRRELRRLADSGTDAKADAVLADPEVLAEIRGRAAVDRELADATERASVAGAAVRKATDAVATARRAATEEAAGELRRHHRKLATEIAGRLVALTEACEAERAWLESVDALGYRTRDVVPVYRLAGFDWTRNGRTVSWLREMLRLGCLRVSDLKLSREAREVLNERKR